MSTKEQPIDKVKWIPREQLHGNDYNPNRVATPEMRLLKISIMEDGWTQPIVVRRAGEDDQYEIVDGFHRWTVSADKEVRALTAGLVPCVILTGGDAAQQRMSTIRHNRARGQHVVLKMADIVGELRDGFGLSSEEIEQRLQMEDEEVDRLYDRRGMPSRAANPEFNKGWKPS